MIYLYLKIHNVTGLKYLGKTTQDPYKYMGSGKIWKAHLRKHGFDVSTVILFQTEDKNLFREVALQYSREFDIVSSPEWANLTEEEGQGGKTRSGPGPRLSEETKKRMSEARKGKPKSEATREAMRRKIVTREHRARISAAKTGKPRPMVVCEYCDTEIADVTYNRWHKGGKCN